MTKILLVLVLVVFIFALGGMLFLNFWPGIGRVPDENKRQTYADRTEYYDGNAFRNKNTDIAQLADSKDIKGSRLKPTDTIPVVKNEKIEEGEEGKLFVTWMGHSTSLVQLGTKNILIDPVFSKYASPVQFVGPKRFSEVPVEYEDMPTIDIMLISHDHYDHLDYKTIKELDYKVKHYIVPLGVESYLEGWGVDAEKITNMAWYENITIDNIEFTATPSQHYTMRNPLHQNVSWWCGYYFKDDYHSVYYTGDGGYCDDFKEISENVGNIDLALLECGQYGKGWPFIHMFPEQAVQAVCDLNPKWTIPVHWGAYCICNNDWDDSIIRFTGCADMKNLQYATPLIGQRVDYDLINEFNEEWWLNINY